MTTEQDKFLAEVNSIGGDAVIHLATLEPWWLAGWSSHVSPSGLGRAVACPRSEAMPHVATINPFASKGTMVHAFLTDVLEHGRDVALTKADSDEAERLAEIDIERLPAFHPDKYSAEVAIAYDPDTRTARELGRNISRAEARRLAEPHELVGIMDIAGATENVAVVMDYKTGWGYVERVELNWQLRTYALMLARLLGLTRALVSIVRVLDNGTIFRDTCEMDELDLLAHEDELLAALANRARVRALTRADKWTELPPLVEGKHCRYCPALAFCPAKTQSLAVATGVQLDSHQLTPEAAAVAWVKIRAAQKTLERWEGILREYSRTVPIPLGDGEILGPKKKKIEPLIPDLVREVLQRQYGVAGMAAASEATESDPTMTKAALRKSLKKHLLPTRPKEEQKITHLEREVHTLLRESRAMNLVYRVEVCEHTPKAEEDDEKEALPPAPDAAA